jgi:polyisoprenoid-binding protein YceI
MLRTIALGGLIVVLMVAGVLGYAFLRPTAAPSGEIEAIPLVSDAAGEAGTTAASTSASTAAASTTAAPSAAASVTTESSASASTDTAAAAATDTAAAATTDTAVTTTAAEAVLMQIVQEQSEARFVIDEVLNNAPFTVVGTTNQVAGEIAVDAQNPSATQVGVIQVNARTLATDSQFRDRAIKNRILSTDTYEFVTFTPKQLVGLPASGTVGETYTFQIVGDLTIRDITREATFDVTVTPTSDTSLEGTAQTTIRYADYGITIPQVRQVASVSDEVRLEVEFVATAA